MFIFKVREQCSKCEGYGDYGYRCPSKSRHVNVVPSDDVDDSRVVEDVYGSFEITSVVDTLCDFSTPILDEIHISFEGTSDIANVLVESSTPIPDDIDVHEDDTSNFEYVLVESSIPVRVASIHLPH